jgi:hypothetical protein
VYIWQCEHLLKGFSGTYRSSLVHYIARSKGVKESASTKYYLPLLIVLLYDLGSLDAEAPKKTFGEEERRLNDRPESCVWFQFRCR